MDYILQQQGTYMATTFGEYYARSFNSDAFFGLQMVINWMSLLAFLWVLGLAYLVIKANPKAPANRFMAVLLVCEGMKMLFQAVDVLPYLPQYESLWDVVWLIKIDVFIVGTIASLLLYFSVPIYYRIERLKFLYRPVFQKHVWYIIPLASTAIWMVLRNVPLFQIPDKVWLTCSAEGAAPTTNVWTGSISQDIQDIAPSIETCPAVFDSLLATESAGLWLIVMSGIPVSILALLFLRSSIKRDSDGGVLNQKDSTTSNSLYIGFAGKVLGNILFFAFILILVPLLNGGPAGFIDVNDWRYGVDRTFMSRLKYFVWTIALIFQVSGVAFEAMMFVHASLKDTVFGIDENLRATFRNAVFTSVGAFLFILGSEVMENVLGFGLAGGGLIGVGLVVIRRPVLGVLDRISNRLLSSTNLSKEDMAYLKVYAEAMRDGDITEREKSMLSTFAASYGLDDERVLFLETYHDSDRSEPAGYSSQGQLQVAS